MWSWMRKKSQKKPYDELTPDECIELLKLVGFATNRRTPSTISTQCSAIEISRDSFPLGSLYCHHNNTIPIKHLRLKAGEWLARYSAYVGIGNADYRLMQDRVTLLNDFLTEKFIRSRIPNVPSNVASKVIEVDFSKGS